MDQRQRRRAAPPSTASAASSTSVSPARGRPRSAASASARRVAAIRWSGDAAMPAGPQHAGGVDEEPAGDALGTRVAEDVGVPAGAARRRRRSRWPRASRRCVHGTQVTATLTFGRPAQARRRPSAVARRRSQRRDVPRPAHHGDPAEPVGDAARPALGACAPPAAARRRPGAACRSRTAAIASADRGEGRRAVAAVLDDVVPPALGVGVAGRGGERAERVDAAVAARPTVVARPASEQRGREVDRPHRAAVRERPADRLPLRAERGERARTRPASGRSDDVAEQGDGRPQPGRRRSSAGRRRRRPAPRRARSPGRSASSARTHRPRRARAVVADAEQVHGRRVGPVGISRASRQAS